VQVEWTKNEARELATHFETAHHAAWGPRTLGYCSDSMASRGPPVTAGPSSELMVTFYQTNLTCTARGIGQDGHSLVYASDQGNKWVKTDD
jgi:hypothetical protein